jgi:effector-binding domain-containing protein
MKTDMGMNPVARIFGLFFDKMIGGDFERGLKNLEHAADSVSKLSGNTAAPTISISESSVAARTAFTVRNKASMEKVGERLGISYGGIGKTMQEQGLQQGGAPFAIYYSGEPGQVFDFDAGIPIAGNKPGKDVDAVKFVKLPATKVVVADFYGPYEKTGDAHMAIDAYLKEKGLAASGAPWEEYVSDPTTTEPSKVLTKVYYPIK